MGEVIVSLLKALVLMGGLLVGSALISFGLYAGLMAASKFFGPLNIQIKQQINQHIRHVTPSETPSVSEHGEVISK